MIVPIIFWAVIIDQIRRTVVEIRGFILCCGECIAGRNMSWSTINPPGFEVSIITITGGSTFFSAGAKSSRGIMHFLQPVPPVGFSGHPILPQAGRSARLQPPDAGHPPDAGRPQALLAGQQDARFGISFGVSTALDLAASLIRTHKSPQPFPKTETVRKNRHVMVAAVRSIEFLPALPLIHPRGF